MNLLEVYQEAFRRSGAKDTTDGRNSVRLWVNSAVEDMCRHLFESQVREYRFRTIAPYETGTVTVTDGSTTLTGSGTTFTSAMVGRKIKVTGVDDIYRISAFVSTTELTLDLAFTGTTTAGLTFELYQDEYDLPYDYIATKAMFRYEEPLEKDSQVWDIWYNKGEFNSDEPQKFIETEWTDSAYYSTGTITNSGATVTGSGTAWDSTMVGRVLIVDANDIEYRITAVASGTSLTVHKTGMSASTSAYEIDPAPCRRVLLYPAPDDEYIINLKYYCKFLRVNNNNEQLPFQKVFHPIIMNYVYWKFTQHQKGIAEMADAKADYMMSLHDAKLFNSRVKWRGKEKSRLHAWTELEKTYTTTRRSADV